MRNFEAGLLLLIQFMVTVLGTFLVRAYARRACLVDVPNERSSHVIPTPRGGGLAIVLAFYAGLAYVFHVGEVLPELTAAFACGVIIGLIGFYDDLRTLSARARLLVQALTAVLAVMIIFHAARPQMASISWQSSTYLFLVVVLVWSTNLFNFMDGIDALAAAEGVFLGCAEALICHQFNLPPAFELIALMLATSAGGFLVLNWPPASIFMGDVGSAFLGFSLALLGVFASTAFAVPIEIWAILSGVFVVDATATLVVRVVRGQSPATAHRTHAYQHLAARRGHLMTVLLVCGVNVLWLLPCALAAVRFPALRHLLVLIALTPVGIGALWMRAGREPEIKR